MKYTATILAISALFSSAVFAHNVSTVDDIKQEIVAGINAYVATSAFQTALKGLPSTAVGAAGTAAAANASTDVAGIITAAGVKQAILDMHCTNVTNNVTNITTCVAATGLDNVYSWKVAPTCKNVSANLFDLNAYAPTNVTLAVNDVPAGTNGTAAFAFNGSVVVPIEAVAKEILTALVQTLNLNDFANGTVSNSGSAAWCDCARKSYYFSNYTNSLNASVLFVTSTDPATALTAGTQQYFVDTVQRKCFAFVAAAQTGDARALIASAVVSTVATVAVVASFL